MDDKAPSVSTVKQPFWRTTKFVVVVAAVALVAAGFYGGVQYQKHHSVSAATGQQTASGMMGNGYGGFGGGRGYGRRGAVGSVTAISSSSITIQPRFNGSSTETFTITSATQVINNGQTATASDIKVGDTVMVTHSASDTSQATRIVINPATSSTPNSSGNSSNSSTTAPTQSSI